MGVRLSGFFYLLCVLVQGRGLAAQAPSQDHTLVPGPALVTAKSTAQPANARAQVTVSEGLLEIRANSSSLSHILREVTSRTGITITGTVPDEQVYGQYGPAAPSVVLAALLTGTGSNLLMVEDRSLTLKEVILSERRAATLSSLSPGRAQTGIESSDGPPPASSQVLAPSSGPVTGNNVLTGGDGQGNPPILTPQQRYDRSIDLQTQQRQARAHQ